MILLTGNAGFIGRYLTSALITNAYEVRGLDIRPRKDIEKGFTQIEGNILDRDIVGKAMAGVDSIIHLAAEHKDFGISKEEYLKVNVEGTKILLEAAAEQNIKKFIFYSSVAVYGSRQPSSDTITPQPNNHYGASKLKAEEVIREWAQADASRRVVIIRPTVVFGPRNHANIFRLVKQVSDGRFIWVGNGSDIKSVAYVENVVDATVFLFSRMEKGLYIYNYADSPHLTTKEIVYIITAKAGVKVPKLKIPWSLAITMASTIDVLGKLLNIDFPITSARIRKFNTATCHKAEKIFALGFHPRFTIEEGLEKMVKWYIEQRESLNYLESAE
jgi:nucleoside-diphosphate-sugar epimerase